MGKNDLQIGNFDERELRDFMGDAGIFREDVILAFERVLSTPGLAHRGIEELRLRRLVAAEFGGIDISVKSRLLIREVMRDLIYEGRLICVGGSPREGNRYRWVADIIGNDLL